MLSGGWKESPCGLSLEAGESSEEQSTGASGFLIKTAFCRKAGALEHTGFDVLLPRLIIVEFPGRLGWGVGAVPLLDSFQKNTNSADGCCRLSVGWQ